MRTVLYANRELSAYLRENYVLAWTSERPVPRVTIDFGDGRVLERTLTGNAAHYVLDSQGRPLDVLPGLYEPGTFMRALIGVHDLHVRLKAYQGDEWDTALREAHLEQMFPSHPQQIRQYVVQRSQFTPQNQDYEHSDWQGAAMDQRDLVRLDRRSVVLMARDLPRAERRALTPERISEIHATTRAFPRASQAAVLAESKMGIEMPTVERIEQSETGLQGMLARFMETLTEDTLRNERGHRYTIRGWFAVGEVTDFESLNERVYREIFLTPRDDPWLGLKSENTYSALHQADTQN